MNTKTSSPRNSLFFLGGFASILGSILVWTLSGGGGSGHGERFGIFLGLWAPTFFILAERCARIAAGQSERVRVYERAAETAGVAAQTAR
jgi:hypothetical protein